MERVVNKKLISVWDNQDLSYEIPEGVEVISKDAFKENSLIASLLIPKSVKEFEHDCFRNLDYIDTVWYDGTIEDWAKIKLKDSASTPWYKSQELIGNNVKIYFNNQFVTHFEFNNIETINEMNFNYLRQLQTLSFDSNLKTINTRAFFNCINLTKIEFSQGLEKIEEAAFLGCDKLKNIILPQGLQEIGLSAFQSCYDLKYIYIPKSVICFGKHVFNHCNELESLYVEDSYDTFKNKEGASNILNNFNVEFEVEI